MMILNVNFNVRNGNSCASLLYANGVALKDIQEWLGHSDIGTTSNIYTHLDYSNKVSSANAIMSVYPNSIRTVTLGQQKNQESLKVSLIPGAGGGTRLHFRLYRK